MSRNDKLKYLHRHLEGKPKDEVKSVKEEKADEKRVSGGAGAGNKDSE
jgi:hypothetical protein